MKKKVNLILIAVSFILAQSSFAQVVCSASENTGSGYGTIESAGLEIENPDCKHTDFGPHVTQEYDSLLQKYVFKFHSHIIEDNDRCMKEDRVRMELKGGPGSDSELQHQINTSSYYRWKCKLPSDFKTASSFCHIFQNKIFGGTDSSFPVITITPRGSVVQINHNGGDSGSDLGVVASININEILGKWIEIYVEQFHAEEGAIFITFRDLSTGEIILSYENDNIDLWRANAEYDRPKWGIYRSKNDVLKDETILFADFCVSETSEALCPADTNLIIDESAPTAPTNLAANNVTINSVDLSWNSSEDNVSVTNYILFQDNQEIWTGSETETTVEMLTGSSEYEFYVLATDAAANISDTSNFVTVMTQDSTLKPSPAFNPSPSNGDQNVAESIILSWTEGINTDSVRVYFGTTIDPELYSTQTTNSVNLDLEPETTYYWQIESVNQNGDTLSPLWTFTTAQENPDFPWLTYRANDRPEIESSFFELNTEPENPLADDVIDDPNGSTNSFYQYHNDTDTNFRWRYRYDEQDTSITIVARFKAIDPDVKGVIYYEIRGFGWREKIRINQSTIKLEKSVPVVEVDLPNDLNKHMHIIRMVMKGQETKVYWNENPEPIAVGISGDDDTNEFFEWGKSGSQEYGGIVDWICIALNKDYAPGEGEALPSDLFLSSDATLKTLTIDGESPQGFDPCTYEYDYEVSGGVVPTIEYETMTPLSNTTIDLPSTVPDTEAKITVFAQDGFTEQEYTIFFKEIVSAENSKFNENIEVYPNPVRDKLYFSEKLSLNSKVHLYDYTGKAYQFRLDDTRSFIEFTNMRAGYYYLRIKKENGQTSVHPIIIE